MVRIQCVATKDLPGSSSTNERECLPAPSFEISVSSDEGICLFVDMSLSSLEWTKRFENEVCVCCCLQRHKFRSFREELQHLSNKLEQRKSSHVWDTNSSTKANCVDDNFDSGQHSYVSENNGTSCSHLDVKIEPSGIVVPACNHFQDISECLEQEGENSILTCLNSVASEFRVDVDSVYKKAPLNTSSDAQARGRSVTATTPSLKLPKRIDKFKPGGGCRRIRHLSQSEMLYGQNSGRILRSAKGQGRFPRRCKVKVFK